MNFRHSSYRYIVIALLVAAAMLGAYLLGRVQSPRQEAANNGVAVDEAGVKAPAQAAMAPGAATPLQLPARNSSLQRVFAELRKRADAGDAAAATRLYRDLRLCGTFRQTEWALARSDDELLEQKIDANNAQGMEEYRDQLDTIEDRKRTMRKYHELCDGVDRVMLDAQVPTLRKAAQLGEEHARACYLARGPGYDAQGLTRHPEWLQDYRAGVKSMIDQGLAAGDWKVVDILLNAYQPGSDGMLAGVLEPDPIQYYRYLKLYRLGAEPYRVADIDRKLAAAAAQIPPEQRADADVWAQARFQQEFKASTSTDTTIPGWDPCTFPYDPL